MFKLGKSRELDDFAIALAKQFASEVPPGSESGGARRLARAIDDICNRAKAYQREHRLGVYGTARVGTAFKIELQNTGYPQAFVDDFTRQLLLIMSGK
jgi:hypothetical protein